MTVSQLTIDSAVSAATATPGAERGRHHHDHQHRADPVLRDQRHFTTPNTADQISDAGNETASSGTLSIGTTGAVWTGDVPVGGTVTITGSIIVANPYPPGSQVIALTDATTAPGSNCPAGQHRPAVHGDGDRADPGADDRQDGEHQRRRCRARWSATRSPSPTTGQTAYTGAVVTDSLTSGFDDAAYDGDAAATAGAVSYAARVLTWTGSLAVGARSRSPTRSP